MAARDAKFNNYLKKALKNKLRYPEATSFRDGEYFYDYDFIFQQARLVLPQKYGILHSYLNGTPISNLNKQELNQLNLKFAHSVVDAWGGLEENQTDKRYLDPVLVEYESPDTAPDESDFFHQQLAQHQLPEESTPEQENNPQEGHSSPDLGHPESHLPETQHFNNRPPAFTRQTEVKLNKANQSMQQTKARLNETPQNPPQLTDRMNQRLNSANRSLQRSANNRPSGNTRLSSRTRKRIGPRIAPKLGTAAILGGGGGAASGGLLGNLLGARGAMQLAKSTLGRIFPNLGRLLGNIMPEKLIAQGLRGLGNIGSSFGRAAFDGLARNAFNILPRAGLGSFGGASSAIGGLATGAGAIIFTAAFAWWSIFLILFAFLIFSVYDANTECGSPGKIELNKTANKEAFEVGEEIQYTIILNYNIKCTSAYIDKVVIKDTLPLEIISYLDGSAKSTKTMEIIDPTQIQDSTSINEPGSVEELPQIDTSFPAADNISVTGNTITWQLGKVTPNYPITMTFSATAVQNDTWVPNQALITYQEFTTGGPLTGGSGSIPDGGDEPPNANNCNGAHKLNNPIGNFGDPSCNFTKDALYTLLQQQDSSNADYWFNTVVKCESGYAPNAFADPIAVGTPDAVGAWGLFQMGRGKNGQYDHGDVPWQKQTTNAVTYNENLGRLKWRYWQCARDRW